MDARFGRESKRLKEPLICYVLGQLKKFPVLLHTRTNNCSLICLGTAMVIGTPVGTQLKRRNFR